MAIDGLDRLQIADITYLAVAVSFVDVAVILNDGHTESSAIQSATRSTHG